MVGIATAYYLNQAGHEVTVVEQNEGVALGTSFANGGIVSAFTARPWAGPEVPLMLLKWFGRDDAPYLFRLRPDMQRFLWAIKFLRQCTKKQFIRNREISLRLSTYSYACLTEVREKEQIEYDQLSQGVLHLCGTEREMDEAAHSELGFKDKRFHPKIIDMAECLKIEPALESSAENYAGALYYPQDESGDAHKFTVGLANAAERQGVQFCYETSLEKFVRQGRKISGAKTDKGLLEADSYVVCLGSFSPIVLKQISIRMPIYPLKGYSITIPTSGYSGAPKVALHESSRRVVMSRLGERLRVAGTAELTGYDNTITPARIKALIDVTKNIFPNCGDFGKAKHWAGLRPMTPDCLPILGTTSYDNLYINTGHGSTGWTYACGSGQVMADIISGVKPEINLSGLTSDRF